MGNKNKLLTALISMILLLGGCFKMDKTKDPKQVNSNSITENKQKEYKKENYVSVQKYTGEGYALRDSREETGQIAEEHRAQVEKSVQQFFIDNFKTEVNIHNMVSAADGVSVFVESVGEPHFYTFAIVPVDIENKSVKTDDIWSQEGQVENAIKGGLYAMAFEKEFEKLDAYMEDIAREYPIVGLPVEAIENVMGTGYTTSYYFVTPFGEVFQNLYERYIENPKITKQELMAFFNENSFDPKYVSIGMELYMKDADTEPDEEIYNKIFSDIEQMDGIPKGTYSIMLNDNFIDRRRGIGAKENTIDHTKADGIRKE